MKSKTQTTMTRNDAICIAHTYHFADLAVRGKATAKRILGATLFEDADRLVAAVA